MTPDEKLVIFTDIGCVDDWSVEYFVVPKTLDLDVIVKEWQNIPYDRRKSFHEWLQTKGARELNEQDTEICFITDDEGSWTVGGK